MGTEINLKQIRNNDLTGASFSPVLQIYNETASYNVGDIVFSGARQWRCKNNVTPSLEGDMSNAPQVSPDWEMVSDSRYVTCSTITDHTLSLTEVTLPLQIDTGSAGFVIDGDGIKIEKGGVYLLTVNLTTDYFSSTEATFGVLKNGITLRLLKNDVNQGGNTACISIIIIANDNDVITITGVGGGTVIQKGSNVTLLSLASEKGDKGDTGSGSNITVTGKGLINEIDFDGFDVTTTGTGKLKINRTVFAECTNGVEQVFNNQAGVQITFDNIFNSGYVTIDKPTSEIRITKTGVYRINAKIHIRNTGWSRTYCPIYFKNNGVKVNRSINNIYSRMGDANDRRFDTNYIDLLYRCNQGDVLTFHIEASNNQSGIVLDAGMSLFQIEYRGD